jgi:phage shock protein A
LPPLTIQRERGRQGQIIEFYNTEDVNKLREAANAALRENQQLREQLSVACGFHGEDLVPALVKRNRELEQQLAQKDKRIAELEGGKA